MVDTRSKECARCFESTITHCRYAACSLRVDLSEIVVPVVFTRVRLIVLDPQVFEMIKPRLWCKGWSGMDMALELYRDMFW